MTLRTYIDHAIRDGAAFDAVICGCDVQQTFCWQPDMCITDACEAEYRPLLDGCIPPEALVRVTRHPALAGLPFILETPNDDAGYAQEIAWLRAAQK